MSIPTTQPGRTETVDVKVTIPELADIRPFWLRDYPLNGTFAELYQDCINHEDVRRSRPALQRISRHFWFGEKFLPRTASLASQLTHEGQVHGELSLVLRRDLYRVGPPALVSGNTEFAYADSEDRIDRVVALILNKSEKPCCFDLCDWRGRRLTPGESLASHSLWPAWEEAKDFPERASLRLRARTGWLAYVLLAIALLGGLGAGYLLLGLIAPHFSA